MLSTGRVGRALAVVCGGSHNGTIVRLLRDDESQHAEVPRRDPREVLDEDDFMIDPLKYRLLPLPQRLAIAEALARGDFQEDEGDESEEEDREIRMTKAVHRRAGRTYKAKSSTEFRIDSGAMVGLPSQESERIFVAARSGAGKSCWAACYMREYLDMFPGRTIYLFSTHEDEKAYQAIQHTAIPLDVDFPDNIPQLEDLRNSLCVFDDCDHLTDKKIAKACDSLNANLISNGRKYDIHVLTLAHMITEQHRTRVQLMEANRVVFFPQGGSQYHNKRYLKVYAGLSEPQAAKLMSERSRWICLDLRSPMSYITENAVVVV